MKTFAAQALVVAGFVTLGGSAQAGCAPSPDGVGSVCGPQVVDTASMPALPNGLWQIMTDTSPMDDSKSVFATLPSKTMIDGRYGGAPAPAKIVMRCMEHSTNVLFMVNDHFLADVQGYGRVEYRIDDKKAAHVNAEESTDNMALGLWSGKRAIPFIKSLFGGERLTVRITPYNESPYTMEFDIRNTEAAAQDLRAACGW